MVAFMGVGCFALHKFHWLPIEYRIEFNADAGVLYGKSQHSQTNLCDALRYTHGVVNQSGRSV